MQAHLKSLLVILALTASLAACAPGQPNQEQVLSMVQTSVASTMQAQNQVGTFVAQTVVAQATATEATTPTPESTETPFPTLTPISTIFTPTTASSGGSSGGGSYSYIQPGYACDVVTIPRDNTQYVRNEHFIVKFTLINTGTEQWCNSNSCPSSGGPDFTFDSGTIFLSFSGPIQLNALKSGKSQTLGPYGAVAPSKVGTYIMVWKLQGPICYGAIQIKVTK